jgi:predicted nucleic acid-binding Zn ribbon protein
MKCPHCGKQIADSSQFCEYCGKQIKKNANPKGLWIAIVLLSLAVALLAGIMIYRMTPDTGAEPAPIEPGPDTVVFTQPNPQVEDTVAEPESVSNKVAAPEPEPEPVSDFPRRDVVRSMLSRMSDYEQSDNFDGLETIFAPQLLRYYKKKNISRSEVIENYRNYDSSFGVYGKSASYRWETLSINRISDTRAEVVCVKDYHIDRVDENKPSDFVLEMHFVIDNNYQVVSVYDNQLSKY